MRFTIVTLLLALFVLGLTLFGIGFWLMTALVLTLFFLAANFLTVIRSSPTRLDRRAQNQFFNNPFRQDLTFRTFPQIILKTTNRPVPDLTIIHKVGI